MDMLKALRYGPVLNSVNVYEDILFQSFVYMWSLVNSHSGPLLCNADLYLLAQVGEKFEYTWISLAINTTNP